MKFLRIGKYFVNSDHITYIEDTTQTVEDYEIPQEDNGVYNDQQPTKDVRIFKINLVCGGIVEIEATDEIDCLINSLITVS